MGSPGFGVEALIIGKSNKPSLNEDSKINLLKIAIPTGLAIVGASILIGAALNLQSIYLCAIILLLTLITGKTLDLASNNTQKEKELPKQNSVEKEIKSMLRSRGLENLIEDDDDA